MKSRCCQAEVIQNPSNSYEKSDGVERCDFCMKCGLPCDLIDLVVLEKEKCPCDCHTGGLKHVVGDGCQHCAEPERKCDCCGWDDHGFQHEPCCASLQPEKEGWEEKIAKIKCKSCEGNGFTSEHNPEDPHTDEDGSSCGCTRGVCPIQVQCEDCHREGEYTTLDEVRRVVSQAHTEGWKDCKTKLLAPAKLEAAAREREKVLEEFKYKVSEWRRGFSMQCKEVPTIERANKQILGILDNLK